MTIRVVFAACALLLTAGVATAQDADTAAPTISLGVSSFGPTLEGSFRFNDRLGARGLWAGYDASGTERVDGIDYDADVTLGGVGLLVDYYPFETGLRLSGGYFISNTDFAGSATSTAGNPIDIGGATVAANETISTNIEFARRSAPMLTVGYDQDFGSNWTLTGEIGAVFTDGFDVNVATSDPVVQQNANALNQEIQNIENELSDLNIYPYLSLKMSLRF